MQGSIYALIAAGFSLLWWVSGIVHLAHGGVMLAGGLIVYLFFALAGLPFAVAMAAGCLMAVTLGLAIDSTIYAPLLRRGTDEMGLLTASLGVLIVIECVLTIAFGPEESNSRRRSVSISGVSRKAACLRLFFMFGSCRHGRYVRYVAFDHDAHPHGAEVACPCDKSRTS